MAVRLANIQANSIAVWCVCGYSAVVDVAPIFARFGDMTVKEAVARMRCQQCRARGCIQHFRIVYVGGSAIALSAGHGQRLPDDEGQGG